MPRLVYTVTARLPDAAWAERYVAWLIGGHTAAVVRGGALGADVVRLDPGADPGRTVEARYLFPDRATFDRYIADFAPALRAEGLALFGPATGVQFERRTGELV